jgi:hypothetical protein
MKSLWESNQIDKFLNIFIKESEKFSLEIFTINEGQHFRS